MSPAGQVVVAAVCAAAAVLVLVPAAPSPARPVAGSRRRPDLRAVAALGVAAGAWLVVGGWTGAVAAVGAGLAAFRVLAGAEPSSARREREEVERTLPHLVALLGSTLRSGADPVDALARVCGALPGPAADRLAPVVERTRWGAVGEEAWSAVLVDPALGPLARAMVRSQASGAPVVQVVERLADELERELLARAEDTARTVGVRAALPLGVCLLPAFLLLGVVPTVAALFGSVAL